MGELLQEWKGFRPGQRVIVLVEAIGADHEDIEHTTPPGTPGLIDHIERYGMNQGVGVTVWIPVNGEKDRGIVNVFDEADGDIFNFIKEAS
ncbi:hypothetical protein [Bradyrhizobium phage BDU-MI-1]|nr:hypothetical protein [Bradyrhizobium phage BDU-MI-1]